ncbi:MAG: hypothetical protein GIW95_09575 [Candidatus Eremiobacteraeota bacterium]|nr:hypothetical protein [Candidatus Eremiobacteraeota bacterium]
MRWSRGFSLIEVLLALGLTLAAGVAVTRGLGAGVRATATFSERAAAAATIVETVERLDAEAHRSAAIFTPARDVLGNSNCDSGGGCREVDFFTRDARNVARFRAYRFDAAAQTLQAYDYDDRTANGATNVRASGTPLTRIETFSAVRTPISKVAIPMLGGYTPRDIEVPLGYPDVVGGNAIVVVSAGNAALTLKHDLLTRFAPTGFGVIVATFTPGPATTPASAPSPPANATTGIVRNYVASTAWLIGPCVNVPPVTPGCGASDDVSRVREQNGADVGPGGTLVAPLGSQIVAAGICGASTSIFGAHDPTGAQFAKVVAGGATEYWTIGGDGSYVAPSGALALDKPGDPNPFATIVRNGPGWSYLTTYQLWC